MNTFAEETIERAKDVHDITDAAWDALPNAIFGGASIALSTAAVLMLVWDGLWGPAIAAIPVTGVIWFYGVPAHMKWKRAIKDCEDFTREMKDRREKLEKFL